MERIRDHHHGGMTWRQPRPLVPEYELRRGGTRFATLEFPGGWRFGAEGRAFDRAWRIERAGPLRRTAVMRDLRTERPALALQLPLFRKAHLRTPQGRAYVGRAGWGHYRIEDADGSPLVRFDTKARIFSMEADVVLTPRSLELPELPELVVAGWFLAVLDSRHAWSATTGVRTAPPATS